MGLDIRINVMPCRVLEECEDAALLAAFRAAVDRLELDYEEPIRTRPGSYHGLHRLRRAYAESLGLTGYDATSEWEQSVDDSRIATSHLIQHSDCDGYYLPDDFPEPAWLTVPKGAYVGRHCISVGSSVRLLAELQSFDPVARDVQEEWDSVFVTAVASVVRREVVRFT